MSPDCPLAYGRPPAMDAYILNEMEKYRLTLCVLKPAYITDIGGK